MRFVICLLLALGVLAPADAAPYIEHFLHVKPETQDLSAFRLDRYVENEAYEVSFDKTVNVRDMRLILKADTAQGLSKAILATAMKPEIADTHYVTFNVAIAVEVVSGSRAQVFSGSLGCQAAPSAEAYGVAGLSLLCHSLYDEGDAGELLIEPVFGSNGVATEFRVHFKVPSQKVLDHEGTPDGDPFVGVMLNGEQYALDQSAASYVRRFANARPVLRLADPGTPVTVRFVKYELPAGDLPPELEALMK